MILRSWLKNLKINFVQLELVKSFILHLFNIGCLMDTFNLSNNFLRFLHLQVSKGQVYYYYNHGEMDKLEVDTHLNL